MMRSKTIAWSSWNTAHITGHGGSVEMAETIIRDPNTAWAKMVHPTYKGTVLSAGRSWTIVVQCDEHTAYPITMYPTKRGGRRNRKSP
jgi:hypothetical protein